MKTGIKVCLISSMHSLYDDRIYWKEAISLKDAGYNVFHLGIGEKDEELITEQGIKIIAAGKKKYFDNPYADKLYRIVTFKKNIYKKLLRIAAGLKADIYHIHDLQINKIGRKLKNLEHKPRLIYDVHEDYPEMIMSYYPGKNLFWLIFKIYAHYIKKWELSKSHLYDFIIAAYPSIKEKFHRYNKELKIDIIYNYTNMHPADSRDKGKRYDAIYIGAINRNRGAMEILKAAKYIKSRKKDIKLLFLGHVTDDKLKLMMQSYIGENELSDNIEMTGPVPYGEVSRYLSNSRIGLGIFMPTTIYFNAIQIKTFEYMIHGLPIVCSNFGYINKFVSESGSGIPVNPESPREIGDAILKLLSDDSLYKQCSRNGEKAVKEKYNWKIMEKRLLDIYSSLLVTKPATDE
jgi:glycosyltransferase involved in cell wall biosynthesis